MKKQLLYTIGLALIITSCQTYKSGTIFGGGFYGKNKVIETDNAEKVTIDGKDDLSESEVPETIDYAPAELESENTIYTEEFSLTENEPETAYSNPAYSDEFNPASPSGHKSFPDYQSDKKSKINSKDVPPDENDDKAVRIILLVLLGFMLLAFLFGLTFLIIFLVLIL